VLLSGGSIANQTAIVTALAAREGPGEPVLYASERVHHSVTKAAHLAGLPAGAIRLVGTGVDGRCDTDALERAIEVDTAAGRRPVLVVGVAGATDTGAIDPLERLASIAAGAGAWFHVDAAYAGFFALTERGRARLRGIGLADSVTIDAHKGLFVPYGVGALLVRDPATLVDAHEGRGAYLRGIETVAGLPHYFLRGPELTRPNRAPVLWYPLQVHGTRAFAAALDQMLDLAELAHERLAAIRGIETGRPPETSIVTFRAADGDAATDALVRAIHGTGRFQVSTTSLDGRAAIRLAFLSPRTTREHVEGVLAVVAEAVARREA
jgi:aromatic-L-amino-acid decarboxylase